MTVKNRNDSTGHFTCTPGGEIVCLDGYQSPDTNCTDCSTALGCCEYAEHNAWILLSVHTLLPYHIAIHFVSIIGPYLSITCKSHTTAGLILCTVCVCVVYTAAEGGFCEQPGDCLCRAGFTGPNCSIPGQ